MAATAVAPVRTSSERTLVSDLPGRIGERVELRGWFTGMRRAKAIRFLVIRDRTGSVQAIHRGGPEAERLDELTPESAVRVVGTVREGAVARYRPVEIEIEAVELVAAARAPIAFDRRADAEGPPGQR